MVWGFGLRTCSRLFSEYFNFLLYSFYLPQVWTGCWSKPRPHWEDGRCGCALETTSVPVATPPRAVCPPGCICPATEWGCWSCFRDTFYGVPWQAVLMVALQSAPGKELEGQPSEAHKVTQWVRAQGKIRATHLRWWGFGLV